MMPNQGVSMIKQEEGQRDDENTNAGFPGDGI